MAKETILVVDDEEDILELVRYNLEREGYRVVLATSGEKALAKSKDEKLDLVLTGIDGLDVAKRLKQHQKTSHIPIIMLTAKGEEADIVTGLELGADDYVTKPFSPRVLLARVKAVLRRQTLDEESPERVIQIHRLTIDPRRRHVQTDSGAIDLTFTEFQILYFLAKRPGWVFTRSQIVDAVRGDDYPVTERAVDVQIVGLRKKLGTCADYIETVRGVGYRFKEKSS